MPFDLKDVIQKNSNNKSPGTANRPKNLDITNQFNDVIANQNEVIDYTYDFDVSDNLIPNDREASFANIVQATVVETSARSVRDPSIGSKLLWLLWFIMILMWKIPLNFGAYHTFNLLISLFSCNYIFYNGWCDRNLSIRIVNISSLGSKAQTHS